MISLVNKSNYDRLLVGQILRKIHYKNIIKLLIASICYEYLKASNLKEILLMK